MAQKRTKRNKEHGRTPDVTSERATVGEPLSWIEARYQFHTFAYRDPRSAFSSGVGLPVVSPTTVLLGVASTLFSLGEAEMARDFLTKAHLCQVVVDPPEQVIFFRAFHQLRRYETGLMKTKKKDYKPNPRLGLTNISQGTREYGIVGGAMTIYVGAPPPLGACVELALRNRDHLGTHDSLCSLVGDVKICKEPSDVVYRPLDGNQIDLASDSPITVVTLSRFKAVKPLQPTVGEGELGHWWMAGGDDTELVPYMIKGTFRGTTRGKIYTKS